jgi:ribonuclease R
MAAHLADRVGAELAARVASVAPFGCFVTLEETGADALVPMARLPPATWHHDPRRQTLAGGRLVLRAGDPVLVRLDDADPLTGGLLCSLIARTDAAASPRGRDRPDSGSARPGRRPRDAQGGPRTPPRRGVRR